jgi:hypothetical protein
MKVFCRGCIFLEDADFGGFRCVYPKNIKIDNKETWKDVLITQTYLEDPKNLNKNNSCNWYKKRRWYKWKQ